MFPFNSTLIDIPRAADRYFACALRQDTTTLEIETIQLLLLV
jgi:hypothetical protein